MKRLISQIGLVIGGKLLHNAINRCPQKYSLEWIKSLSDDEWKREREIVRQNFCNPKFDNSTRISFQNILRLFDKIKSEKDWAGKTPSGPAFHREHGWYISKDD